MSDTGKGLLIMQVFIAALFIYITYITISFFGIKKNDDELDKTFRMSYLMYNYKVNKDWLNKRGLFDNMEYYIVGSDDDLLKMTEEIKYCLPNVLVVVDKN